MEKELYNALQTVVDNLTGGLIYDGAHHKQYYLEEALKNLMFAMGDKDLHDFKAVKNQFQWEEGIPA